MGADQVAGGVRPPAFGGDRRGDRVGRRGGKVRDHIVQRGRGGLRGREEVAREHGCNVWTSKVAINTRAEYEAREESEDMPEEVIRASVHYFNAEWEVDKLCAAVEGLWIASLKADTGEIL